MTAIKEPGEMPLYIVTGRDRRGRAGTELVPAGVGDEAVTALRQAGWTDLDLHSNEYIAFELESLSARTTVDPVLNLALLSPRWSSRFLALLGRFLRSSWWLLALFVGGLTLSLAVGSVDLTVPILFFLSAFGFPLFTLARLATKPVRGKFARVDDHLAWGRWDEAIREIRRTIGTVSPLETTHAEAIALAGSERLEQALTLFREFLDDPSTPHWLYWDKLGHIFMTAQEYDRAVTCFERSLEHAPRNVTAAIVYASVLLQVRRDARNARAVLEGLKGRTVSSPDRISLHFVNGLLALEEKRPAEARALIQQALDRFIDLRHLGPPVHAIIDRVRGALCLACAACGDHAEALEQFRRAEPRLRALKRDRLLDRCEAVVGKL